MPWSPSRSAEPFLSISARIPNDSVSEFLDALVKAGQRAEYVQVGGASHAFFDWKPNDATKATFAHYGVYYAEAMRNFFLSTLAKPPS